MQDQFICPIFIKEAEGKDDTVKEMPETSEEEIMAGAWFSMVWGSERSFATVAVVTPIQIPSVSLNPCPSRVTRLKMQRVVTLIICRL
jgi:hypothetical protein